LSLGDSKAVSPLILKLRDKDIQVRSYISWALGKIKDARAVDPLIEALMDTSSVVRESAAFALSEIRDKKAVDPMIKSLQHEEDPYVRGLMANFLGDFNDSRPLNR
jgi:HEAT repeat protein